jgi:hypothetical protein
MWEGPIFSEHISSLKKAVVNGCHCDRCVTHLIAEVVQKCSQVPLEHLPEHPDENGSAAHLRTELEFIARALRPL